MRFQIGDVVRLKSGGPEMVVTHEADSDGDLYATWFKSDGSKRNDYFKHCELELVRPATPPQPEPPKAPWSDLINRMQRKLAVATKLYAEAHAISIDKATSNINDSVDINKPKEPEPPKGLAGQEEAILEVLRVLAQNQRSPVVLSTTTLPMQAKAILNAAGLSESFLVAAKGAKP